MHIRDHIVHPPFIFGRHVIVGGLKDRRIKLNKQEVAALRRAAAIAEKAQAILIAEDPDVEYDPNGVANVPTYVDLGLLSGIAEQLADDGEILIARTDSPVMEETQP